MSLDLAAVKLDKPVLVFTAYTSIRDSTRLEFGTLNPTTDNIYVHRVGEGRVVLANKLLGTDDDGQPLPVARQVSYRSSDPYLATRGRGGIGRPRACSMPGAPDATRAAGGSTAGATACGRISTSWRSVWRNSTAVRCENGLTEGDVSMSDRSEPSGAGAQGYRPKTATHR